MRHIIVIFIFLTLLNKLQAQSTPCYVQKLFIHASLNGYFTGETSVDWIKQQNCLNLEIDTITLPGDKKSFIELSIKKYKDEHKDDQLNSERIKIVKKRYSEEYDNYKALNDYDLYKNSKIIGFTLSGNRCCFVTSAFSDSNCLSDSQLRYIDCVLDGDWISIENIKVKTNKDTCLFDTKIQFKIKK